jgi:aminoglycoside phosphotransferase (APT) family kinase protein
MSTELAQRLQGLLRIEWSDPQLEVSDLERLTGGASRQTWRFRAESGQIRRELILRQDPAGVVRLGDMALEAAALRAAAAAGVPEPEVYLHSTDPAVLGSPFMVMSLVEGQTIPRKLLRDPEFAQVRPRLAGICGELLARIHSIPRSAVPGLPEPDQLRFCTEALAAIEEPHPILEVALRWLQRTRPAVTGEGAVVHGDFRNGNLMVGPEGVRAVLDWEVVHWGDPAEDLGFLCVKAWRFGAAPPVGGFGGYAELLEGYARAGGRRISLAEVRWWEILGTLRWALSCLRMTRRHLDGVVRSVELAAIGRRTCEQEWDLLEAIREVGLPHPSAAGSDTPAADAGQGLPTAIR